MQETKKSRDNALSANLARRTAVGDILAHQAVRTPRKTALKFRDRQYDYGELNGCVNRLAHGLAARGIGKGDSVAVLSHNCDLMVIGWFALLKLGAVMVPVNWLYKGQEIEYVVNHSEARMLIAEDVLVENVEPIRETLNRVEHFVRIPLTGTPAPSGWTDIETLMDDSQPDHEPETLILPDDPAVMIYTSGTESAPKGVLLTHLNLTCSQGPAQADLKFNADTATLIGLPLFHGAALEWVFFTASVGGKAVVLYLPDPMEILEITEAEKINYWVWVTTLYVHMLQLMEKAPRDLSSLKTAVIFGSYISTTLMENWKRHAPDITFISAYGQTECVFCTSISGKDFAERPSSVGRPFMNTRLMIEGKDGKKLPPEQPGEILVRSPAAMLGYFKEEEKTRQSFRGGWLHTGDIGRLDADGFLYFMDRVKDMIKTGGENVASTDVEEALSMHPGISEVAVIGLYHPVWQEAVTAVVVPVEGHAVTPEEIIAHCKEKMAAYKIPKEVIVREALPKSNVGKVLKRDLKQIYADTFKQ